MTEAANFDVVLARLDHLADGQETIREDLKEYSRQVTALTVNHAALSERVGGLGHRVGDLEQNPRQQGESFRERIPWWGYIIGILALIIVAAFFGLRKELLELIAGVPVP